MSVAHEITTILQFSEKVVLELRVVLIPEDDGSYSAIARDLPGVASQGESQDEAVSNIRDAFAAAFEDYRESSTPIPWKLNDCEIPPGAQERWILVDG